MGLDWASWVSAIVFGRIRDELEHLEEGARIVVPHETRRAPCIPSMELCAWCDTVEGRLCTNTQRQQRLGRSAAATTGEGVKWTDHMPPIYLSILSNCVLPDDKRKRICCCEFELPC